MLSSIPTKNDLVKILSCFFVLSMGATMNCATNKTNNQGGLRWTGKFPVLVIGHRGFSAAAPENTLASFKKAMEVGVDMIELDVHLSKDGQVVVIHDDTLNRTTNGKGKVVSYTLDELKQLDAGSWFGSQFSGERIPTLKEVLELTRGQVLLYVELKGGDLGQYTLEDLADRSLQEVEKAGMLRQVLFASFDLSAIERIREKNPGIPVALIYSRSWSSPQEVIGGRPIPALSFRGTVLTQTNASKARQQGIKVLVWTLNTEEHMEHFLKIGVDGIITDYPDRLIKILQKRYQ
jgi:glycerophosphoryl diester phosphodiesterase